jgi:hypothetical protein
MQGSQPILQTSLLSQYPQNLTSDKVEDRTKSIDSQPDRRPLDRATKTLSASQGKEAKSRVDLVETIFLSSFNVL